MKTVQEEEEIEWAISERGGKTTGLCAL